VPVPTERVKYGGALFRSVTQRSDERRATPWQTLMTDLFVALITTTQHELREPKPLRLR
jgi:hypothetical protein